MGLTSHYRWFVQAYAAIAEPLTRLLRDNTKFQWDPALQHAFEELKQRLTSSLVLLHPHWSAPFKLQTHASDLAIAAILAQVNEQGHECVVSNASRQLTSAERKYMILVKRSSLLLFGNVSFSVSISPVFSSLLRLIMPICDGS